MKAVPTLLFRGLALALGFFSGPTINVVFVVAPYLAQVAARERGVGAHRPPSYRVNSQLAVFITELPIVGQLNLSHPWRVDLACWSEFAFSPVKDFVTDINDLLFQCAHSFLLPYFGGEKNLGFVLRQQSRGSQSKSCLLTKYSP